MPLSQRSLIRRSVASLPRAQSQCGISLSLSLSLSLCTRSLPEAHGKNERGGTPSIARPLHVTRRYELSLSLSLSLSCLSLPFPAFLSSVWALPYPLVVGAVPAAATQQLQKEGGEASAAPIALSAAQVRSFVIDGYLIIRPEELGEAFHTELYERSCDLKGWRVGVSEPAATPPPAVTKGAWEGLPEISQLVESPTVKGALSTLLGEDCVMHPHRALHTSNSLRDQVRISCCAHSNLHTNLKSGSARTSTRTATTSLSATTGRSG
eukprot:COSAG03_NODE_4111_length_1681_cov_4.101770_3_plen_266_part_00